MDVKVKLDDWNDLITAAKWLSAKSGQDWTSRNLIGECKAGRTRIVFRIPGWGRPMEGELLWFKKEPAPKIGSRVNADKFIERFSNPTHNSDGMLLLNEKMCDELLFTGSASLRYATMEEKNPDGDAWQKSGEVLEARGENLPCITIDQVRISRTEVEKLWTTAQPYEQPADVPRAKIGRPTDLAEKQRVVLAIAEAFAEVIPVGDDKRLPPTKKNFLEACRRLEKSTTDKTSFFKDDLTADTVADWLHPSGYKFKRGTPPRANIYTTSLPKIAGKINKKLFTEIV
jgi:hypothetical protein